MIGCSETARDVAVSINLRFIRDSRRSAKANPRNFSPLQQDVCPLVRP